MQVVPIQLISQIGTNNHDGNGTVAHLSSAQPATHHQIRTVISLRAAPPLPHRRVVNLHLRDIVQHVVQAVVLRRTRTHNQSQQQRDPPAQLHQTHKRVHGSS